MAELQTMPLRFRVWDKDQKCFLTTTDDDGIEHQIMDIRDVGEIVDWAGEDNIIISQGTGFVDKNGRHIFTGDIVNYDGVGGWAGVVVFEDGVCFLKNGDSCQVILKGGSSQVVIGNIFENPELLENKK